MDPHALVPDVVALQRLLAPPAPAKAIAPRIVAIPISCTYLGKLATPCGAWVTIPVQADKLVAMTIATTRKARMIMTNTISTLSMVL
jgi:hypothetical protein